MPAMPFALCDQLSGLSRQMAKAIGKKNWLTVIAAAGDEPATIRIDGSIGKDWWDESGTSSKEFSAELDKIPKGTPINLYVNSTGGSIGDGMAIFNAIAERAEDVTCCISGYALSIASVIPLAAGKVISPTASIWMMHDPLTYTQGNAKDHADSIKMLETHADTMANIYAAKTGKSKAEVRATMQAETWMSGDDAIAYGLADEAPETDPEMSFNAPLDLSKFKNCPINSLFKNQTTMKTPVLPVAATPPPAAAGADPRVDALIAQLAAEKKTRITNEVNGLAEGRIPNDQVERWIARAVVDETVIADLRAMPVATPGIAPLPWGGTAREAGDRLAEIRKLATPAARYAEMKRNWTELYSKAMWQQNDHERRGLPVSANTFSSSLTTNFLMDGSVTQLQNRWAPLAAFTRDHGVDRYKPLATGELKFVTGGSTGQTNPTNWESGDSTVTNVAVTVAQYAQSFHVTNSELNSGLRMENLVDVNTAVFANTILGVATAPMTDANFTGASKGQPHSIITSGGFGISDLSTFWGYLKKSPIKNAIIDGEWYAKLLNTPTNFQKGLTSDEDSRGYMPFGWDGIYQNTSWSASAQANISGFFCNPQAIGTLSGLPISPPSIPGATLQESTFFVPGADITVGMYSWFSLATRTMWVSYDLMFGASLLDPIAGFIMTSA